MKANNRFCRRLFMLLCLLLCSCSISGIAEASSLNASSLNLLTGETFSLFLTDEEIGIETEFESRNPDIASVSEDGTVTALSGGTAKIICDTGSGKYQCTVNVYDPGLVNMNGVMDGIDVSVWQGKVDYNRVKAAGIDFVIMRAGYSTNIDTTFTANYENARAAGLLVGAYWYSTAKNMTQLRNEAASCLGVLSGREFDLPVFFDVEDSYQLKKGTAFCSRLVKKFSSAMQAGGYDAGWYTATSFVDRIKPAIRNNRSYMVWIAEHGPVNHYEGRYDIWQYSHKGRIDGVNAEVDLNWYFPYQ